MRRGFIAQVLWIALFGVLSAGWLDGAAAQQEKPIKIAYSMLSKETASAWVAEEKGFFKKNGISTNMILIQSGTTLIQALVAGDVDVGFTVPPAVISAAAGGADLKIVLGQANSLNFVLVGQPELRKIQI